MIPRSVAVAAVLLLFPIAEGVGQAPPSNDFLGQAGALQTELRQWHRVLTNLDFSSLAATDAERQLLSQDRSAALASIKLLDDEISGLERKPTLEGQVRVVLDLNHLQGSLSDLADSWRALAMPNLHLPRPDQWPVTETAMTSEIQRFYDGLNYQLMRQFNAAVSVGPADEQNQPRTGQISGHIYRADTGEPLAGSTVTLRSTMPPDAPAQSTQSAKDGSYKFSGLAPATYELSAYHSGFARALYGFEKVHGGWTFLTLAFGGEQNNVVRSIDGSTPLTAPGGKLDNIDLKLNPVPRVTQMNAEALGAAYLEQRVFIRFQYGRFSPDGKLFAVTTGDPDPQAVWFYDLTSRRLTPVIPPAMGGPGVISMGWAGDTLYAEQSHHDIGGGRFFSATAEGAKEILELPAAGEEALKERLGFNEGSARNERFIVTTQGPFHGPFPLTAQTADGRETFTIAEGSWELQSFVLVPDRSLVLYPTFFYPAVVVFDLNTRKSEETFLPVRAERLLDVKPEADGFLIAYTTLGPCDPGDTAAGSRFQPLHRPKDVCFAKIPAAVKK
jgi:hypothetical protein